MMTNKPNSAAPSSSTSPAASSSAQPISCGNCGLEEKRLLHNVRYRGVFRRLCTTCVLRLNPQSFCPTCFSVYPPAPPSSGPNKAVICFKCYSASHSSCVGPNIIAPYICPLCVNPNSQIFNLKKVKDSKIENGGGEYRVIDEKDAKILFAAAKIASISMNKAAIAAREEAVRRAKEAAVARKRAREAMEHVAYLVAKEKTRKKELGGGAGGDGGSSVFPSVAGSVRERRDNFNHGRGGNNVNGVVRGVGTGSKDRERQRIGNLGRVDRSNEVVAALNAVELREGNNKVSNVENLASGSGQPSNVGGVDPMDVEREPGLRNGGGGDERSGILYSMENHGQNVSNGKAMIPPGAVEVHVKNRDINQTGKQNDNGSSPSGQGTS